MSPLRKDEVHQAFEVLQKCSLSRWRGENVKKSARDRENVQNVTDEKEVAISDYRLLNCNTFSF